MLSYILERLKPQGHAVEFGVAAGTSLNLITCYMPAVGFDSFEGLPEDWCGEVKGWRACVQPAVRGAELVVGLFADTLPLYDFEAIQPIGLVHCDADLYSSTKTALEHVGPHLEEGAILVFDEWHCKDEERNAMMELHEQRAWREYANQTGVSWDVIGHDHLESWAIRIS
jgi:hypothetical protein